MRILILGGTGLLGQVLQRELADHDVVATGSRDANVRDIEQIRRIYSWVKPEWTLLLSAYTDVDGCEVDPERAFAVNTEGARNVAEVAAATRSRLIFLSTDYIFDGSKRTPWEIDDTINPLNVYGRSKADGEALVRAIAPEAMIVRTSWIFGLEGRCFPRTILELANTRPQISIVNDQRGAPTYNVDLARAMHALMQKDVRGTVHVTNSGDCTWHDLAVTLVERARIETTSVHAITSKQLNRPAKRPEYSVLSHKGLRGYGIQIRDWRDAVRDYVSRIQQPVMRPIGAAI
jgi:dTDP-4-dehydrorhamnose reductase